MKFLDGTPRKSPRLSPIFAAHDYDVIDETYGDEGSSEADEPQSKRAKIARENESYDVLSDDRYNTYDS